MSSHYPPLTCKEVKKILKNLGFASLPRTGTSHEKWVNHDRSFSVIVDCPKEPFSHTLIALMAKQAGVSRKQFYAALNAPLEKEEQIDKSTSKKQKIIDTVDME